MSPLHSGSQADNGATALGGHMGILISPSPHPPSTYSGCNIFSNITLACSHISYDHSSSCSYTEKLQHQKMSSKALLTVFYNGFSCGFGPSPSSRMLAKHPFLLEVSYYNPQCLPACSNSYKSLMPALVLFKLEDVYHWRTYITGGSCKSIRWFIMNIF